MFMAEVLLAAGIGNDEKQQYGIYRHIILANIGRGSHGVLHSTCIGGSSS
jgi:hypothetical protein